jgi:hypothetical protein
MDILCDDMGSWKNNRVDSIPVAVSKGSTEITSVQRLATSSRKTKSNYTLRRVYRVHRTDKTLKKIIASLYDYEDKAMSIVLVAYKFDNAPEHPVVIRPHGNSTGSRGYIRTMKSAKKNLQKALESCTPKDALDTTVSAAGGLINAQSAGQLPLSRQQAYNINHALKRSTPGPSRGKGRDLLYSVMEQCKMAEKKERFVQEVTCAPEPMAILATSQQLLDLERFCCDPVEFAIMGVDPTFNLGEFSVTPTVYQHLMVCDKRTGKSPWLLGPILVHYQKEFRNYNFFFSGLIGLRKALGSIKAAGTDGEQALIQALRHQFREAILLRCFRHLEKNIERRLQETGISPTYIKKYMLDIFGYTDKEGTHQKGLVDCHGELEFHNQLSLIKDSWDKRESEACGKISQEPFHTWFVKNKANDFIEGALQDSRELAGLGCPPVPYYTNANESLNRAIKNKVNFTKQQWPIFNDKMKEFIDQQQREVDMAIIGGGRLQLRDEYKHFEVTDSGKWWRMSEEQKKLHLQRFHSTFLTAAKRASAYSRKGKERASKAAHVSTKLSVGIEEAQEIIKLPKETVEGIWSKAEMLLVTPQAMAKIPGGGPKDRFVLSSSGSEPHHVKARRGVDYKCDDKCLHYRSISICSHVVAVSQSNGDLHDFLQSSAKSQMPPNLFQMAKHTMPAGAGKKGGRLP